jgi:hypothetical protein
MALGTLRFTYPDGRTEERPLELPVSMIGRSPAATITVEDITVSRRHARVSLEGGALFIEDLGSSNGTFLAGQRLAPETRQLVRPDAECRIGDIRLDFVPAVREPEPSIRPQRRQAQRSVKVAPQQNAVDVTPDVPRQVSVTVTNTGGVVDEYDVIVEGAEGWVEVQPVRVRLTPEDSTSVLVLLKPPLATTMPAGIHNLQVIARSTLHHRAFRVLDRRAGRYDRGPAQGRS